MTCFTPIKAFQAFDSKTGEIYTRLGRPLNNLNLVQDLVLPCGKCDGCKLEYSRVWAVRCTHEASLFKHNCFLTLTYDNYHLPPNRSLVKADFQKFMKRFRKRFSGLSPVKRFNRRLGFEENLFPIRFYMCGEYGEQNFRPHYHSLIFNFDFPDKVPVRGSGDYILYSSEILQSLWPLGFSSIGAVNFKTAGYVARYALKGVGDFDRRHYAVSAKCCPIDTNKQFPEIKSVCIPQYTDMSRAWGIGSMWYDKFGFSDVYAYDSLIINSVETRPPRFYDNLYAKQCGEQALIDIKRNRMLTALQFLDNNTPDRLATRQIVKRDQVKRLSRRLGYDS